MLIENVENSSNKERVLSVQQGASLNFPGNEQLELGTKTPAKESHDHEALRRKKLETRLATLVLVVPTVMTLVAFASLSWRSFTLLDAVLFFSFYMFTSLGVTLGYHRLLTHNSFKTTESVKNLLTIAAQMSVQGPAIWWVAHHRKHHIFSDTEHDVHSPKNLKSVFPATAAVTKETTISSFFHGHVGWMLQGQKTSARKYAGALMNDQALLKIDRLYLVWIAVSLLMPAVLAALITAVLNIWGAVSLASVQSTGLVSMLTADAVFANVASAALGGLLWGGFARIFFLHHTTWSVNSVCHALGRRPFKTNDVSRNNFVVAFLTNGEGWHNAHHAFPNSAKHGLRPFEFDLSWQVIRILEKLGLAWDIKVPSRAEIENKLVKNVQTTQPAPNAVS